MKTISLTKNKFALVDDKNYAELSKFNWYFDGRYAARHVNKKKFYLHKIILDSGNFVVDHINGNKLDNRIINLRVVSHSINGLNRLKTNKNNSSGFRGVSWNKGRGRWDAYVKINFKKIFLGRFANKEDAITRRKEFELCQPYL